MLMGLQDAERGQMGITRVQVIVLHTRVPEEQLKESQKPDQDKEHSRDREKSREKCYYLKASRTIRSILLTVLCTACPKGGHLQVKNQEYINYLVI